MADDVENPNGDLGVGDRAWPTTEGVGPNEESMSMDGSVWRRSLARVPPVATSASAASEARCWRTAASTLPCGMVPSTPTLGTTSKAGGVSGTSECERTCHVPRLCAKGVAGAVPARWEGEEDDDRSCCLLRSELWRRLDLLAWCR